MKRVKVWLIVMVFSGSGGWAQQADIAAKLGFPQTILYNGKIVTMDSESFGSNPGTIVQAMAIRNDKILATGNNAEIRALAGPQTRQIDLKGREVLPNFMLTHEHPTDWVFIEPRAFRHVLPNDDVIVSRWMPNLPPKEQMAKFDGVVKEAVGKAKPGQWVRVVFNWGPDYEWATEMQPLFSRSITKEYLDQLAPNNPLSVKNGFIGIAANSKAAEEFRKVHPDPEYYGPDQRYKDEAARVKQARDRGSLGRPLDPDVMLNGKLPVLADLLKSELELWASYGITGFGSSPYAFANFQALSLLDEKGEMPARFAWGYTGNFTLGYTGAVWDTEVLRYLAGLVGKGSDYLWLAGAWNSTGSGCMSIPERDEWVQQRQQAGGGGGAGGCNFEPGSIQREILERIIESGLRVATIHTGGDKDIDYLMDAIEAASKRAGITLDQIRAQRFAFDHGSGAPRPEQIPRIKNLGMMVSQINTILWETHRGASVTAKQYGIEYTDWVVPRKTVNDAGIRNTFEIDRPLPHKIFFFITKGMNRYNDRDQRVYGPNQKTDRIVQLRALTRWAGFYFMKEDRMGTLEPGKLADFIVIDRDFLTIPESEIPQTDVLMTMVGGKIIHLKADLAREIGTAPVGPTTWREPLPEGWLEKRW
ncbi:MAG: amidohydrolase family protein [Acidobacteria bacterium]|nr:amidohydrolase family protein [Acidobacteriota bacterium]